MKEKLEYLLRYYWPAYLTAAVLSVVFVLLVFRYTEPVIPPERELRVKIATDFALSTEFIKWHKEAEKDLDLAKVSVDYTQVDRGTPDNKTWEYFNVHVYLADADAFFIPANKARELAAMDVLAPLEDACDGFEVDEEYVYPDKSGNKKLFALPVKSDVFNKRFGIDIPGEEYDAAADAELIFCIPAYSKNTDGAIAMLKYIQTD